MESTRDEFSMSWIDHILEALALLALVGGAVLVVISWIILPDSVPMHFDMSGAPDRYGSKVELWALLGVFVLTYLSMAVPARLFGYARRARTQQWVTVYWPQMRLTRSLILWFNLWTMLLFAALMAGMLAVALGLTPHLILTPVYGLCGAMAITLVIWMIVAMPVTLRQVGATKR